MEYVFVIYANDDSFILRLQVCSLLTNLKLETEYIFNF